MAVTKINFYMSAIFLVLIVFIGLGVVGTDFINNDRIDLNEDSIDYILELKGLNNENGYSNIANTSSSETQKTNLLDSSDDSQVSDSNDFLSTLYIKKERASAPTNLFKLIYNIPTTMIMGMGWDVSDWNNYINIISYFLFIGILIMIWTKLINT